MKIKKLFKTIGLSVLAGSMVLGLVACGSSTDANSSSGSSSNSDFSLSSGKLTPSQMKVMGETYDIKDYMGYLTYDSETRLTTELMDDFNANDTFAAPYLITLNMKWYTDYEWSELASERRQTYKTIAYGAYNQQKEGDIYGYLFEFMDPQRLSEKPHYDFKFFNNVDNTWTINDYAKSSDFTQVAGQVIKASDFLRFDMNRGLNCYGNAYMAIYLDGKLINPKDYESSVKDALADIEVNPDNLQNYYLSGVDYGFTSQTLRFLPFRDSQWEGSPMKLNDDAKKVLANDHCAYFAVKDALDKIKNGEAEELVVINAEEEMFDYENLPEDKEGIVPPINVFYYYITN